MCVCVCVCVCVFETYFVCVCVCVCVCVLELTLSDKLYQNNILCFHFKFQLLYLFAEFLVEEKQFAREVEECLT